MTDTPQVVDDPAASRFMIEDDGQVAELVYQLEGERLVLIHTGVPAVLEGRGIGSRLVAAAIDEAKRRGLTVVPQCPFAKGWLRRHPDAAAEVPIDQGSIGQGSIDWGSIDQGIHRLGVPSTRDHCSVPAVDQLVPPGASGVPYLTLM